MKQRLQIISCFVAVLFFTQSFSQDWKKNYTEEEAVYTSLACEITIKNDEGKLSANSQFQEEMQVASENAAKMMSRGHIYHSSFNELKKWTAYTQVTNNKKLKVANANTSSSRQEYIFFDDSKITSFDFAGITAGATRHMEYELQHNDLHLLMPYYFDRYFPVINGKLSIVFPSSVKIKYLIKGLNADKVQFSELKKKDKTTYVFTVSNLAGEQHYPDAPDNSYYSTHVVFYIEKVIDNGQWKNFLSGVDDLYQYNYNYIKNINQNIGLEVQQLTDSLTKDIQSDIEKTRIIYQWVQKNVKYVAFEEGLGGFIPREANLVCNRRFGDCKDMASILTAMLNHAKVPAFFTWIGTRHIPYKYTETPLPIVDNHMICAAKLNGEFIFLDGTDNSCVFGMPSTAIQGKEALIALSEKEYKIVLINPMAKERNKYSDSTFLLFTDKGLGGHIKIYMTGYFSSSMTGALMYRNEKEREEYFKSRFNRGNNKLKFTDWKVQQSNDKSETWVTANFELPDYAKKLGDEWLLNLNLFKWYEHKEIDYPKRKTPIEHEFLHTATYTTVMALPDAFKVSYKPKSQSYKNDVWGFDMKYTSGKGSIILTQKFDIDQLMLYPGEFEQWNKVLENLFPHYKQSVVLSKN